MKRQTLIRYLILGGISVALYTYFKGSEPEIQKPRDYAEIAESGVLNVTTEYNQLSLHVEGDSLGGFHYALAQAFADDHHLKLNLHPEMSHEKRVDGLENGTYDLIANNIQLNIDQKNALFLTAPVLKNRYVLVQREVTSINDSNYIRSAIQLAGKTIHVVKEDPVILRLQHLSNEIADTIYIKEVEKYGAEQLIDMVAHGDIDYTVCEENIAKTLSDSIPQIDIHTQVSFNQFYSWAVSRQSPVLLDSLNQWIETYKKGKDYQKLLKKYHLD